mgnify:CR=1 FL=1
MRFEFLTPIATEVNISAMDADLIRLDLIYCEKIYKLLLN